MACKLGKSCPATPFPCLCKGFNPTESENACFYCGNDSNELLWCNDCNTKLYTHMSKIKHPSLKWLPFNRHGKERQYFNVLNDRYSGLRDLDDAYEADMNELTRISPVVVTPAINEFTRIQPSSLNLRDAPKTVDKAKQKANKAAQNRLKALLKPKGHRRF